MTSTSTSTRNQSVAAGRRWNARAATIAGLIAIGAVLAGCAVSPQSAESSTRDARESTAAPAPSDGTTAESGSPTTLSERPGYARAEDLVVSMYERYSDETRADYAYNLVPQTQDGNNYAHDFLLLLADARSVFRFTGGGAESMDTTAFDAQITTWIHDAIELDRKFLAGEDFGVSIKITNRDGSVYESDGSNGSNR